MPRLQLDWAYDWGVDAAEALDVLKSAAGPFGAERAPHAPGVYAWFLDEATALRSMPRQSGEPIYIGTSSNLAQRRDETHFKTGGTGFSTLRRSLGALLKDELNLRALPRGTGPSDQNFRCYRFDDGGEARLTGWMRQHLRVGICAHSEPEELERGLIALAQPPLNLTGWANPHAAELKALRKACADEARETYTE
jgi:hypothetical protein